MQENVSRIGKKSVIGSGPTRLANAVWIVPDSAVFIHHYGHHQHSEIALGTLELCRVYSVPVEVALGFGPHMLGPVVQRPQTFLRIQAFGAGQAIGTQQIDKRNVLPADPTGRRTYECFESSR
jgi:hypothetical protein